ncbi:hypothetical protein V1286_001146 [Bradyrhizobium algeriense]|uniref:Uncharacterized protein n=1 Tax=Bradyrhizobium algeriense TaxID=634784 RepID=A0ABU8B516_9BRAD
MAAVAWAAIAEVMKGAPMHAYRAYLIGWNGHIVHRVDIECDDDEAAKERAKLLVDGHDVELWDGGRKITEFKMAMAQ